MSNDSTESNQYLSKSVHTASITLPNIPDHPATASEGTKGMSEIQNIQWDRYSSSDWLLTVDAPHPDEAARRPISIRIGTCFPTCHVQAQTSGRQARRLRRTCVRTSVQRSARTSCSAQITQATNHQIAHPPAPFWQQLHAIRHQVKYNSYWHCFYGILLAYRACYLRRTTRRHHGRAGGKQAWTAGRQRAAACDDGAHPEGSGGEAKRGDSAHAVFGIWCGKSVRGRVLSGGFPMYKEST